MNILSAFVQFVWLCSLWAGLCFAVYGTLRAFGRRFPLVLSCLGTMGLLCWCALFGTIAVFAGYSWADGPLEPVRPYPYLFVGSVGATLMTTLAVGGWLIRRSLGKSWWQGLFFCSLYMMVVHPLCGLGLGVMGLAARLGNAWMQLTVAAGMTSTDLRFSLWPLILLLMWLFPLGAPIAEMSARNFQRVLRTNQQGYSA